MIIKHVKAHEILYREEVRRIFPKEDFQLCLCDRRKKRETEVVFVADEDKLMRREEALALLT